MSLKDELRLLGQRLGLDKGPDADDPGSTQSHTFADLSKPLPLDYKGLPGIIIGGEQSSSEQALSQLLTLPDGSIVDGYVDNIFSTAGVSTNITLLPQQRLQSRPFNRRYDWIYWWSVTANGPGVAGNLFFFRLLLGGKPVTPWLQPTNIQGDSQVETSITRFGSPTIAFSTFASENQSALGVYYCLHDQVEVANLEAAGSGVNTQAMCLLGRGGAGFDPLNSQGPTGGAGPSPFPLAPVTKLQPVPYLQVTSNAATRGALTPAAFTTNSAVAVNAYNYLGSGYLTLLHMWRDNTGIAGPVGTMNCFLDGTLVFSIGAGLSLFQNSYQMVFGHVDYDTAAPPTIYPHQCALPLPFTQSLLVTLQSDGVANISVSAKFIELS